MKTPFILAVLVVALCGCQTSSKQFSKVQIGMSELEVVKILGKPASKAANKDGSVMLYFTLNENGLGTINSGYSVKLIDGKVDSYGRDAGTTSTAGAVVVPVVVH